MGGRKSSVRDFSVQIRDKIFFGPTLQHLKKIPFPIENYMNPLENWHFEGSSK